jgi:hypothetical protein
VYAAHCREVNDNAAIVHGVAGDIVASTPNRQEEPSLARKVDRFHDVGRARAPHDQCWVAIDQAVLNSTRVFILRMPVVQHATTDAAPKILNCRRVECMSWM